MQRIAFRSCGGADPQHTLEGRGELATAAGSGGFRICRAAQPSRLSSSLPGHACWDAALSTLTCPSQCRVSRYSDLLLTEFELQAKGPELVKSPVLIKESHPFFSSCCSVLRRAGDVAVKWASLLISETRTCCLALPHLSASASSSLSRGSCHTCSGVVVKTRGAAVHAWCVGARCPC